MDHKANKHVYRQHTFMSSMPIRWHPRNTGPAFRALANLMLASLAASYHFLYIVHVLHIVQSFKVLVISAHFGCSNSVTSLNVRDADSRLITHVNI